MQLPELREKIQACGDAAAIDALAASLRALGNLTLPHIVPHCEWTGSRPSEFVIHVLFPSAKGDLPLVEIRYMPSATPAFGVHLVAVEDGQFVALGDELVKDTGDAYADLWQAMTSAQKLLWILAPPEPDGAGLL